MLRGRPECHEARQDPQPGKNWKSGKQAATPKGDDLGELTSKKQAAALQDQRQCSVFIWGQACAWALAICLVAATAVAQQTTPPVDLVTAIALILSVLLLAYLTLTLLFPEKF